MSAATAQQTAPPPAPPTGSNTIVVACKLPNGLKLELGRPGEDGYETHTLKGTRTKGATMVDGAGFALTTLPREFWERWLAHSPKDPQGRVIAKEPHRALRALKDGHVYAHTERSHVEAHAVDNAARRTGLEGLTPKDMPRGVEPFKKD